MTKTIAKKRAWKAFSQYIRQKYADENGFVKCYTCDKVLHYKEMQAGHGIGGRNNAVLFMEEIVRPQERGCNIYGRGKYSIFTEKLMRELGAEEYFEIIKRSNRIVQYKTNDYLEIEKKYKEKLKEL